MAATLTQAGKKRGYYHIPSREGSKADVIAEIQAGTPKSKAPLCVGVGRQTYYDWIEQDPQFAFEVEQAEALAGKSAMDRVLDDVDTPYKERGDVKTKMELLKAYWPEFRSGPETQINIGQIGNNTVIVSEEKVEGIRKLREAAVSRKQEKRALASVVYDNPAKILPSPQQSASALILGKALVDLKGQGEQAKRSISVTPQRD